MFYFSKCIWTQLPVKLKVAESVPKQSNPLKAKVVLKHFTNPDKSNLIFTIIFIIGNSMDKELNIFTLSNIYQNILKYDVIGNYEKIAGKT